MDLLLAEDLMLLLLDDETGAVRQTHLRPLLGGAVLADLALTGAAEVEEKRGVWHTAKVHPVDGARPSDALLAAAYDDEGWDATVQADTDEALALTGKDVGTPILHIAPPEGAAFFGPVISRVPSDEDALRLWDHVVGLATFPGFAEMKRSLRELPQLRALGVAEDEVGRTEDWHGGSRRLKK